MNRSANFLIKAVYSPTIEWGSVEWADYDRALAVVNNWRAAHGHPLNTFQTNLRTAAPRFDPRAIIAQRTKRLSSILHKLTHNQKMKLTQMQDIGGCRAVLKSVAAVQELADYYLTESRIKHELATVDDYISAPRASGYRGIHLVYRYFSDKESTEIFNGLKIEMQIRSLYQHAWATAVETVGTFVGDALKSSIGSDKWLRFFALMGTAIATRERTSPVPNTPEHRVILVSELMQLASELDIERRLRAYGEALRSFEEQAKAEAKYYLLDLDIKAEQLTVIGFKSDEINEASQRYLALEKEVKGSTKRDAVLVSVDSLQALPRAYPNYFADTRVFLELLRQALVGRQRRIFTGALRH